ncbi:M48 family metalloprotease [Nitrospira defluvii]|nr:M48 family metalloprotease [Nitrospira defluvii]
MKFIASYFTLCFLILSCTGLTPKRETPPVEPPPALDHGKELGKQFMKAALKEYRFVKDPEVIRMVNRVGNDILKAIGEDPSTYHFFVVRKNQLNAFAIPGGYIFLFDGLIKKLESVDALAGVLAHEIAHVQRNHFFKNAKKINAINLATMASIILAGLAGEGQGATGMIAMGANISLQLKFSRENEEEADLYAIRYLRKTAYHPSGLADFFGTLGFYQRFTRGIAPPYFSTHPGVQERKLMVELQVKNLPRKDRVPDSDLFDWERIGTILRAADKEGIGAKGLGSQEGNSPLDEERRFYFSGLSALKSGEIKAALQAYEKAIQYNPNRSIYYADLSMVYMHLQEAGPAKEAALKSIRLSTDNAAPYLVLGMIALTEAHHEAAVKHLETARGLMPEDPMIHYQLARSYNALSKSAQERFYLGRYYRLNLEPEKAISEFQKALGLTEKKDLLSKVIQNEIDGIVQEGL